MEKGTFLITLQLILCISGKLSNIWALALDSSWEESYEGGRDDNAVEQLEEFLKNPYPESFGNSVNSHRTQLIPILHVVAQSPNGTEETVETATHVTSLATETNPSTKFTTTTQSTLSPYSSTNGTEISTKNSSVNTTTKTVVVRNVITTPPSPTIEITNQLQTAPSKEKETFSKIVPNALISETNTPLKLYTITIAKKTKPYSNTSTTTTAKTETKPSSSNSTTTSVRTETKPSSSNSTTTTVRTETKPSSRTSTTTTARNETKPPSTRTPTSATARTETKPSSRTSTTPRTETETSLKTTTSITNTSTSSHMPTRTTINSSTVHPFTSPTTTLVPEFDSFYLWPRSYILNASVMVLFIIPGIVILLFLVSLFLSDFLII